MKRKLKKALLIFPIAVAALLLLGVWLADNWLESSQGRHRLEKALSDTLGVPVRLQGEFGISLIPRPGVVGTHLSIGAPDGSGDIVRTETYLVSVALLPLLDGKLIILALKASGGHFDPAQMKNVSRAGAGEDMRPARLPQIDRLILENINIPVTNNGYGSVLIHTLELENFQAGVLSPLTLDFSVISAGEKIARLVSQLGLEVDTDVTKVALHIDHASLQLNSLEIEPVTGDLSWELAQNIIDVSLGWQQTAIGDFSLASSLSAGTLSGQISLDFTPSGRDTSASATLDFALLDGIIDFPSVQLTAVGQSLAGSGCLHTGGDPSLDMRLAAEEIDLDELKELLPGGESGQGSYPLALNIELTAREIQVSGMTAHRSQVSTGQKPDCGAVHN